MKSILTIITYTIAGRIGVWRTPGSRFSQQNVRGTRKSGRKAQMYWGAISYYGRGRLIRVNRKMNKEHYVRILEKYLLPYVNHLFPGNDPVYIIEDNSSIHRAHVVRNFYDQHPKLQRLVHPTRSPDLNPIGDISNMHEKYSKL